jgi:ribonuclease-3
VTTRNENAGTMREQGRSSGSVKQAQKRAGQTPVQADASFFDYKFKNPSLLTLALTHSSLAYENNPEGTREPGTDNEQLEFIGDAVLGLAVAEALYRRFPGSREGDLTRLRASLVSSRNLAEVAQRIHLGPMLRLGRGEEHSGGQKKPALLANALEAVIAAMYLDGGLAPARDFILRHIVEPAEPELEGVLRSSQTFAGAVGDYKSALQEWLQAAGEGQPKYVMTGQSGPDHKKQFRIEVRVTQGTSGFVTLADAEGTTKKLAQQEAARRALASLLLTGSVVSAAAQTSTVIAPAGARGDVEAAR